MTSEEDAEGRRVVVNPRHAQTRCTVTVDRVCDVRVEVVTQGLSVGVSMHRDDAAGLPAFVVELAEQVAGWDGPARWRSVDGDLTIDATWRPGTWTNEGWVTLDMAFVPSRVGRWEVRLPLTLDAAAGAEMQTWGAALSAAFAVDGMACAKARYAELAGFSPDLPQVVDFIPDNDWCWWVVHIDGFLGDLAVHELFGGLRHGRPLDPALSWEQVCQVAASVDQCHDLLLVATRERFDLVPEEVEREDFSRCVFVLRCVDSGETTVFVSTDVPGWEQLLDGVRAI